MVNQLQYVGIPKRFLALFIDSLIQSLILFVLFLGVTTQEVVLKLISYFVLTTLIHWGYFSLMESSSARGTLGKMALGIAVCDRTGGQISFKQASIRYLGKYLWGFLFIAGLSIAVAAQVTQGNNSPYLLFAGLLWIAALLISIVGYLMAGFTPERQALHDRMARTYVIEDESTHRTVPQKVAFQMIAIAVIARLLFHVLPGIPSSVIAGLQTNNNGNGNQINSTTSSPSPDHRDGIRANPNGKPDNNPNGTTGDKPDKTASTIMKCGVTEQLLKPTANAFIDGEWKLSWAAGVEVHQSVLQMKGENGSMFTQYFNSKLGKKQGVVQKFKLRTSANGVWLLGSEPIDVETKQISETYSADSIFIQRSPEGQLIAFNCDNNNNLSRVTIERFNPN